ncbi:MAG TPA: type VI secretion system tip protein TssI/VgrG [Polyangium sp.]|nr:type VI secretion system tip protein TssI/VgrG [Polyangium sp.]
MSNALLAFESGDHLDVRTFAVHEALSASFQIDVVAMGAEDVNLDKISGRPVSFGLSGLGGNRIWTGVCSSIVQTGVETDGLSSYAVTIVPVFWLLTQRRNYRVFQHLSVPQIVQKLLGEWQLPLEMKVDSAAHPVREYTVQYGESDHDFLRRLLVDAGISYSFATPPGAKETKMTFTDAPTSAEPRQTPLPFMRSASMAEKSEHVTAVTIQKVVKASRAVVRDFDFRRPSFALAGTHAQGAGTNSMLEEYFYRPGSSNVKSDAGANTPIADKEGAYRHTEKEAAARAQRHTEAMNAASWRIGFNTSTVNMAPGHVFSMTGHPHPSVGKDKKLLVTSSFIVGEINEDWNAGGEAVSADAPFKPLLTADVPRDEHRSGEGGPFKPLSKFDKPRIQGLQSAVVVGPKGEDIHVDEYGRVKLQFPWDREAQGDDKGSCWVRVAQAWAGPGFGMMTMPRVGQEVLVGFVEGDPDLPMVVGRMFDTTSPVPYPMPENKTRTVLKSNSKNGGNEITFEDKADGELLYLSATRDLHKIVKKDELETTRGNRHVTVDGDLILSAKGNVIIQAGKELVVKGGPKVQINPPGDIAQGTKPGELGQPPSAPQLPPKQEAPKPEAPKPEPPKPPAPTKSKAAQQNERLFNMPNPGGPTGKFQQTAAARRAGAEKYQELAKQMGEKYNIPPAMALAWMNRESAYGEFLDANGYSKFDGQGFGMFQVDKRYHTPVGGPADWNHIDQAMGIYKNTINDIKARNPGWTDEEYWAAGLVGYNAGPGSAATRPSSSAAWAQLDRGTAYIADANGDYSRDIWTEAQWYAKNLKW